MCNDDLVDELKKELADLRSEVRTLYKKIDDMWSDGTWWYLTLMEDMPLMGKIVEDLK